MKSIINIDNLNPYQIEILKLMSVDLTDKDFKEIRNIIKQYIDKNNAQCVENDEVSLLEEIKNNMENSVAFEFLKTEEDLYTVDDLKEKY